MKRSFLILSLALCCLALPSLAQKARVGITGGLTISNQFGKMNGVTLDYTSKTGITCGLIVDAPIGKTRISFQPGVHYVQKGAVLAEDEIADTKTYRALRYGQFDFNFVYNTRGKGGVNMFFGLGPSLALNVPSKNINKTGDTKSSTTLTFGDKGAAELNGVDYGVSLITGLQLKNGMFFSYNYVHGIRNLVPGDEGDNNIWNSCMAIRVGFIIPNK